MGGMPIPPFFLPKRSRAKRFWAPRARPGERPPFGVRRMYCRLQVSPPGRIVAPLWTAAPVGVYRPFGRLRKGSPHTISLLYKMPSSRKNG